MIIYPIPDRKFTNIEHFCSKYGFVGICTACGKISYFWKYYDNHREFGNCIFCGTSNRKRQICYMLRKELGLTNIGKITSNKCILNTEASGGLHDSLKHNISYICSEYFGDAYKSGEMVDGILHVNLLDTCFDDSSFDVVLTCDVLEHIPDPYQAFKEIYRILKPGGVHIFTVPFYQTRFVDEKRAELIDNEIRNYIEPLYHLDPLNPNGILVYNIFSIEMIMKLNKIGFNTTMHKLYDIRYGIFGNNAIVFESRKMW